MAGFGAFDRTKNAWRTELLEALITYEKPVVATIEETDAIEIFGFESDTQGWIGREAQPQWGEGKTEIVHDSSFSYEGRGSIKALLDGGANRYKLMAPEAVFTEVVPGKTFIYRIFIPEGSGITAIQPYAQYNNWSGWTDRYIPDVPKGSWITIDWTIPEGVVHPLNSFGIMVHTGHTNEDYMFVDSIEIE